MKVVATVEVEILGDSEADAQAVITILSIPLSHLGRTLKEASPKVDTYSVSTEIVGVAQP